MRIKLDAIVFDAGTQIREALDQQVVAEYAEAMTNGAEFPPIVLFHDGTQHYLADGFHRFMAAQRNEFRDIDAEVKPGTKDDALWFALGANKANGKRLTDADRRRAIVIAAETFLHHKSQQQIADQIGCSQGFVSLVISRNNVGRPDRVAGLDGHSYPATKVARDEIRKRAAGLLRDGKSVAEVRAELGIGRDSAYGVKHAISQTRSRGIARTEEERQDRIARTREMAEEGYTSRQMAAEFGIGLDAVKSRIHQHGIDVPADRAVGSTKRHDANRIAEQIVSDAENLTEGVNLIDFAKLDRERLGEWVHTLIAAKRNLDAFIRRLMKEKQKHGEAA